MLFYGAVGLGVAFLASLFDKMLTLALKSFGAFGGPLLGIFCLGLFSSRGNSTVRLILRFCDHVIEYDDVYRAHTAAYLAGFFLDFGS